MVVEKNLKSFFNGIGKYSSFFDKNNLQNAFSESDISNKYFKKKIYDPYYSVNPKLDKPFNAELDDLIRLYHLITTRKVTTILEFGIGKSTSIFEFALNINKKNADNSILKKMRRTNLFECYSVDNSKKWIERYKKNNKTKNVHLIYSEVITSTFNGKVCTFYNNLPNICPDFIYLDGPDQFSAKNQVRGISTRHPDRLPMSADILSLEHFLLPGTLIVVDGRTANARFLASNLQRNWSYCHFKNYDQHIFELSESPLGIFNRRQIDYCLGSSFYKRVIKSSK